MKKNRYITIIVNSLRCRLAVLCLMLAIFSARVAAGEYSDGLQAYLDGNFDAARDYWSKGAEADDAKAMFNLGLLHQHGNIDGANQAEAEKWFRLAGKHGYAAADYHLALLLAVNTTKETEVVALLKQSSRNGYIPAKQKLAEVGDLLDGQGITNIAIVPTKNRRVNNSQAKSGQDRSAQDRSPQGDSATVTSRYKTEDWIKRRPAHSWTIQMLVFNDEAKVQSFINKHAFKQQAAYYAERVNGETVYKVLYGVYDSKDKADSARQNLSSELKQYGPWLRSIAGVQEAIDAQ